MLIVFGLQRVKYSRSKVIEKAEVCPLLVLREEKILSHKRDYLYLTEERHTYKLKTQVQLLEIPQNSLNMSWKLRQTNLLFHTVSLFHASLVCATVIRHMYRHVYSVHILITTNAIHIWQRFNTKTKLSVTKSLWGLIYGLDWTGSSPIDTYSQSHQL